MLSLSLSLYLGFSVYVLCALWPRHTVLISRYLLFNLLIFLHMQFYYSSYFISFISFAAIVYFLSVVLLLSCRVGPLVSLTPIPTPQVCHSALLPIHLYPYPYALLHRWIDRTDVLGLISWIIHSFFLSSLLMVSEQVRTACVLALDCNFLVTYIFI